MNQEENIIPEAGPLYSALRNSGYSNIAAVGDLVDNSLDAGAKKIKINIAENLEQIYISDNGTGMSMDVLKQALKLGGRKEHNNINDLGKYGLGLITASISMASRLRVITKNQNVISVGIFDVNEACGANKFIASFREATDAEIQSFNYRTDNAESGTVLSIENCDKIQYEHFKDFEKELRDSIKSVFWSFIEDGREIFINEKQVIADDPLYRFDKRTKKYLDKTIEIPRGDGQKERLEILAVLIPDFGKIINRQMHINIDNQGFYFLRNNREIASAVEIQEIFKKHNDFNRFRIKINFGPGLDEEMGVNYTKHNISPSKKIIGILKRELERTVIDVRKETKKPGPGPQLPGPTPFIPPLTPKRTTTAEPIPIPPTMIKEVEVKVRFGKEDDGLLNISTSGDKASIWFNGANKFYKEKIIENSDTEIKKNLEIVVKAVVESFIKNNSSANSLKQLGEDISKALEKSEL